MATLKIYCKKSNGQAPIYLVLRIGKVEKLIFTGKTIEPDLFDNKRETVKRGARLPLMKAKSYLL